MIAFVIYYLVIPLGIIQFVAWFFKKYAKRTPPEPVLRLLEEQPIPKKYFRLVSYEAGSDIPRWVADFETHPDAVDLAYTRKRDFEKTGAPATLRPAYVVLNDKGEALEQV
jgi:hypothetical protein